ncbi:MAG: ferritin-like domain-containing protein [Gammaproteobacteria bacterium]
MVLTAPRWTLDDIDWDRLDPGCVGGPLLAAVKTAALVEANSADYVTYLHKVFADDAAFREAASVWGEEEAQHGAALGRWAERVDPDFDFSVALANFRRGYSLPLEVDESVRGSRAGELLARCVVESGTCSYYSALRDFSDEPVLRQICQLIAQDEAQHYQLFQRHYRRYPAPGLLRRLQIAIGRVVETGDDELGYAYYSANLVGRTPAVQYDRGECAGTYQRIVASMYRERHVRTVLHMIASAVGLRPGGRFTRLGGRLGWWLLRRRGRDYASASAAAAA